MNLLHDTTVDAQKPPYNAGFTLTEMLVSSMIMLLASVLVTQTFTIALYHTRARNWESEAQVWCNYISDSVQKKLLKVQKIQLLTDETISGNTPDENVSATTPDENVSANTPDENVSATMGKNISGNSSDETVSGDEHGIDLLYLYDEPGGIAPDEIFSGDITRDFGQFGTASAQIDISYVENPVENVADSAGYSVSSEKLLKVEVTVADPSGIGVERVNLFYVRPYHANFPVI